MSVVSFKYRDIPGTEIRAVVSTPSKEKENRNIYFVYVAKFPDGNNVLEVKPATLLNPESYLKGIAILQNAFLACVEKDSDSVILKVYQAYKDKFSKFTSFKISINTEEGKVDLGSVKSKDIVFQNDIKQREATDIYNQFLTDAALRLEAHKKKIAAQKTENTQ